MKTDVIIPNPIYETAEQLAQQLGMSLSDFFLTALTAYMKTYERNDVTDRLNQVYATESSLLEPDIIALQSSSLEEESW